MRDLSGNDELRPMFTVVTCTWNRAKTLPRALDSLLSQDEHSWELVVVDDFSADNTATVLQNYTMQMPRMSVVHHETRRGTAAARNAGIARARGRFVTFLDSDDEYRPDHLSTRKQFLTEHPQVQLLHGGLLVIGNPYVVDKDNADSLIHLNECVIGGTFVIRRDVFDHVGYFDENLRYADDSDFFSRAQTSGIVIDSVDYPTYIYHRDVEGQLTSVWKDKP